MFAQHMRAVVTLCTEGKERLDHSVVLAIYSDSHNWF